MAVSSPPLSQAVEQSDESLEATAVVDALGDGVSRDILVAGMTEPVTAEQLATSCGVSESTIYRRLDRLCDLGLVERCNHLVADTDAKSSYRTAVEGLTVRLGEDGLTLATDDPDPLVGSMETVARAIDLESVSFDAGSRRVDVSFTLGPDQFETMLATCGRFSHQS